MDAAETPFITEESTNVLTVGHIEVPSDPTARCTLEQLLSIFGGTDRLNAERDLLRKLAEGRRSDVA